MGMLSVYSAYFGFYSHFSKAASSLLRRLSSVIHHHVYGTLTLIYALTYHYLTQKMKNLMNWIWISKSYH